jgi:multiple antibiotic resistance protein
MFTARRADYRSLGRSVRPLADLSYTETTVEILLVHISATFAALLPITNPFSAAPVFVTVTDGFSEERRLQQARMAAFYMLCVLLGALFAGAMILEFFGITVPIMRIAGGLIIARVGFGMVSPEPEQQVSKKSQAEAIKQRDIAFTPIAMPLLSGPGSIAVAISMATHSEGLLDYGAIGIGIALVCIVCWLVLRSSIKIVEYISSTGMDALTRLMGFILVCIGIQFIATGLYEGLTNPDIVGPIVNTFRGS